MSKCKHCNGKGVYIVKETYGDGDTALMTYECNYCGGTGEDQEAADNPANVFDIGDGDDNDD